MNQRKNELTQAHGANRLHCQQARNPQLQKPGLAQTQVTMAVQMKKQPVSLPTHRPQPQAVQPKMGSETHLRRPPVAAPPVYRPQPTPKVLQTKMASGQPSNTGQQPRPSVAPPVYRPEPQKIVQPKMAAAHASTLPKAPPVYRPQAKPVGVQAKMAGAPQLKNHAAAQASRPQPAPKVLQAKKRDAVIQRTYGSQTTAPQPGKLEYNSSTDATTAMMVLFRYDLVLIEERTFTSGGGLHAEEKVIARLQELVNNGTLVPQGVASKDYIVFLNVSKSPCSSTSMPATRTDGNPGCHERLTALNVGGLTSAGGVNVTFDVQLAATKPYAPKIVGGKHASTGTYGGFGGDGSGGGTFGFVR
jgi:hypothetical protein